MPLNNYRTIALCAAVIFFFTLSPLYPLFSSNVTVSGISLVMGKVIDKETGKGVPGVEIELFENYAGYFRRGTTDNNGEFTVRSVPTGNYRLSVSDIHKTCPGHLIIAGMPESITVPQGKNVCNVHIFLHTGGIIRGTVFHADGKTPFPKVWVSVDPSLPGKPEGVFSDEKGKYELIGLKESNIMINAEKRGFVMVPVSVDIEAGEVIENKNIRMGLGAVSISGKITDAQTSQPIEDAWIIVRYYHLNDNYSGGFDYSNKNGEYSISGLKYPGTYHVGVYKNGYKRSKFKVKLIKGNNSFDFTKEPKKDRKPVNLGPEKKLREKRSSSQSVEGKECSCFEDNLGRSPSEIFSHSCGLVNTPNPEDPQNRPCIKNEHTRDCMQKRCERNRIKFECLDDCERKEVGDKIAFVCGQTDDLNLDINKEGTITLCANNSDLCDFPKTVFHEMFHMCDRAASPEKKSCAEKRAYNALYCVYQTDMDGGLADLFQLKCENCITNGRDCDGSTGLM